MTRVVSVLGQAIIKYDTPQHILDEVNKIYEERSSLKKKRWRYYSLNTTIRSSSLKMVEEKILFSRT